MFFWSLPVGTHASVVFSEVMYDLEGSDEKREWVEIFNTGVVAVDLAEWRFFDGSNHILNEPPKNGSSGSLILAPGEYMILASDAGTFLSEYQVSVSVIDTVMSLGQKNDREYTIQLIDGDGVVVDSMTYTTDQGSEGNSLSYEGSSWKAGFPNPGEGDLAADDASSAEDNQETTSGSENLRDFPTEPQITAFAGDNRVVTVGADAEFKGTAAGLLGEPLAGARYLWNLGDGSTREGESVLYHYQYPGEYIVVLNVSSGEFSATDHIVVSALPALVYITEATPAYVALTNKSDRTLDLSWWILKSGSDTFMLPEYTSILPGHTLRFAASVTGLRPQGASDTELQYPNGRAVTLDESVVSENTQAYGRVGALEAETVRSGRSIVGMTVSPGAEPAVRETVEVVQSDAREPKTQEREVLTASVRSTSGKTSSFWYILALLGVIAFGILSTLFVRRASQDEITILE
ncbi:MAG: lamin tail domain-containing protein [Candidatus Pacebacteria bacterium]|nr:lamin tail domain-containing protein [Candidatus Paceibacterota bacterium]